MTEFESTLREDLLLYLQSKNIIDERVPECPDVEEQWEKIGISYLADGVREFNEYPMASLGWMMYIGMTVAQRWDENWEKFLEIEDFYTTIRDKRGYDCLDEYIREEELKLNTEESDQLEVLVSNCAARVHNILRRQKIEPSTEEAFKAYVACLHQLYLMGAAAQLKKMGYKMTLATPEDLKGRN